MRKNVKTDKRDFVEGLAEEAERAAASRNMKQLYDTTKKLVGKFKKSDRPIRDKNGTVLTRVDKQLNRWAEHFGELLNRPRPHNQPDIQPAEEDLRSEKTRSGQSTAAAQGQQKQRPRKSTQQQIEK